MLCFGGLLVALSGCQREATSDVVQPVAVKTDAVSTLAQQWEKGSYQVDAASSVLADLHEDLASAAKESKGEQKEDLLDVADAIESVGQQIAEFSNSPSKEEIKNDFAGADEDRLRAIKTLNEALVETQEATDLAHQLPAELADAVGANLDESGKAIEEAIRAFGGQVKAPG